MNTQCPLHSGPKAIPSDGLTPSPSYTGVGTIGDCKKEVATSLSDRLALQEGIKYISKGTGCPHCNQTGYKGRIAIHEVIEIDSKVRKMISNQEEIDDIMKYLVEEQGVETLRDQALKLVKEGKTTVDEFNKIIAYID